MFLKAGTLKCARLGSLVGCRVEPRRGGEGRNGTVAGQKTPWDTLTGQNKQRKKNAKRYKKRHPGHNETGILDKTQTNRKIICVCVFCFSCVFLCFVSGSSTLACVLLFSFVFFLVSCVCVRFFFWSSRLTFSRCCVCACVGARFSFCSLGVRAGSLFPGPPLSCPDSPFPGPPFPQTLHSPPFSGPLLPDRPKFRAFFPSPAPLLFNFSLSGGLLVELCPMDHPNCVFSAPWDHFWDTLAACHRSLHLPTSNSTLTTTRHLPLPRENTKHKWREREKKKARNCGLPTLRAPTPLRAPTGFGPWLA